MNTNSIREQFIIELMVFSPKYNAVLAEKVASQMSEEQLVDAYEKLSKINQDREETLARLEETDPEAYEQQLVEREQKEEEADELFFETLEADILADTDAEDQRVEDVERQMDLLAEDAQRQIDADYDASEDLLKNLFEEINNSASATS